MNSKLTQRMPRSLLRGRRIPNEGFQREPVAPFGQGRGKCPAREAIFTYELCARSSQPEFWETLAPRSAR